MKRFSYEVNFNSIGLRGSLLTLINAAKNRRYVSLRCLSCFGGQRSMLLRRWVVVVGGGMNSPVDGCAHANCFKERFFFLYGAVLSGSLFEQKPALFFF